MLVLALVLGSVAIRHQREFDRMGAFHPQKGTVLLADCAPGSGKFERFVARVRFRYLIDGVTHESERWSNMPRVFGSKGEAEAVVKQLLASPEAIVYVNPSDPGEAIFELPREADVQTWGVLAAVVGSLGALSVGYAMRHE